METQEILSLALCFTQREPEGTALEALTSLCETAAERWKQELRAGVEPEDCGGAFRLACAWTALAGMLGAWEAGDPAPRSFTAGDLSVQLGGDGQTSGADLQRQARALMAPYTQDTFAFLEVRG
jgi:hypothetical protein